jgi:signal transduction histidine kinase/DNA-binding response OmpR family regulator
MTSLAIDSAGAGGAERRPGKILIVDDRPEKLLTFEAALESLGHAVVTASSGAAGLRSLLDDDFAVILLDMNMPGMDGFETARLIRGRRRNRDTPIIFITSYGDDVHALEGYALGAVDFIIAPVAADLLRSKVGVFLELFERDLEVRRQADRLRLQTKQLQALTRSSLEIHRAASLDRTLQIVADAAREVIGARSACALIAGGPLGNAEEKFFVSQAGGPESLSGPSRSELRLIASRAAQNSKSAAPGQSPPSISVIVSPPGPERGAALAASLLGRQGDPFGVLLVVDSLHERFAADEEALLVQLAQVAATAVENTIFAEAREANRIKDQFLATLSHELRTPLSAILGWAQLLRSRALDADETAEALEIIQRNGQMQQKMIEDLLDVSRIVTGKLQLNTGPVSLTAVAQSAVDVILPAAAEKQILIDVTFDERADAIAGDADRLQQVLWNLLSNAVKFTPPGGRIELSTEAVGQQVRVTVKDSGEGIDSQFLPYVFDRFCQADGTSSRRQGGLGIGLSIVRHVVELHGGVVDVVSAGKGRGTTFGVSLPQAAPPAPQHTEAPVDPCGLFDEMAGNSGTLAAQREQSAARTARVH